MANRVTVASVIAAVGIVAVIGTMATVTSADDNDGNMLSSVKVSTVCAFTRYPEKCEQSLKHVVSDTSSPEDVFRDALNVALDEVSTAFQRSAHIGKDAQDKLSRNAMDVCKKLLDDATEDLRALARVKPADVVRHVKDLRVWVSGIMTYVYTCADGFEKPELKEAMDKVLQNSTELSSNALAILTRLGDLMPGKAKDLQATLAGAVGHDRRLLGWQIGDAEEVTSGGRGLLDEIVGVANGRRLLSSLGSRISSAQGDDVLARHQLLGVSPDDETDNAARRNLLSTELESIASTSAEANRQLLAAEELPDELAGKRELLSRTLMGIDEAATEAKRQLDEATTENTMSGDHRVLTTGLIGTFDEIQDGRSGVPPSDFPKWLPATQRRLLQQTQKPNTVVAQDGSGDFKTITEAITAVPNTFEGRFVIYVKAGTYKEYVTVPKNMANIFMYGDGPTQTVVTGDKSNAGGFATFASATFSAEGNGFICKSMGFVNTAGPEGHQAVAMHVQGDKSVFYNCRFEGYQDTLYVHANRQFFRDCEVLGTVDFIFGNSAALFQNCLMTVRKPGDSQSNMVTAQGRTDPNMPTGIVLQGCRIVPEQALFPDRLQIATYLGRPWKEYARTVVMESTIGDLIRPEGWAEWMGDLGLKTLYYAEYANTGPGAGTSKRVNWPGYHVIGQADATPFTAGAFIDGASWLQSTGTPNVMGFTKG
ncbi:Pectinesterase [Zea mays]|uniref:Pectinesterase n=1 Tax=Zea mays TaxID=4577 RepID=A0A1D6JFI9_MAIZE|nr:Pectinesterase [Zea mays]